MRSTARRYFGAALLSFLAAVCLSPTSFAQDDYPDTTFFVGSYTLIGKALNSDSTFAGLMILEMDSVGHRSFRRIVENDTTTGTWGIEYAIGAEVRVIRIRWESAKRKYECTYQWSMDFDSYPRLSGHCYETGMATDSPGMEVGFAIWPQWYDEEDINDMNAPPDVRQE